MFVVYIIIGTIPAALAAVLFKDRIEEVFASVHTVSIALLVTGVALWLIRNLRGRKRDGDLSTKDAILVGLAQAVALIPGISRSGATVIASIAVGMKQETALRFSFMLYIPISLGAGLGSIRYRKRSQSVRACHSLSDCLHNDTRSHIFLNEMVHGHYGQRKFKIFLLLLFYCRNIITYLLVTLRPLPVKEHLGFSPVFFL